MQICWAATYICIKRNPTKNKPSDSVGRQPLHMYRCECFWWSSWYLATTNYYPSLLQSHTLQWPESSTDITIFPSHLGETFWRSITLWSKKQTSLHDDSQPGKMKYLFLMPFIPFFSLPLAVFLFPSNTPLWLLFLLPYSPPALMCYPSQHRQKWKSTIDCATCST